MLRSSGPQWTTLQESLLERSEARKIASPWLRAPELDRARSYGHTSLAMLNHKHWNDTTARRYGAARLRTCTCLHVEEEQIVGDPSQDIQWKLGNPSFEERLLPVLLSRASRPSSVAKIREYLKRREAPETSFSNTCCCCCRCSLRLFTRRVSVHPGRGVFSSAYYTHVGTSTAVKRSVGIR